MAGATLDAGPLIAADRNERTVWAFAKEALGRGEILTVPAPVLAQAWRGKRSASLARFMRMCSVESLDDGLARVVGELCARASTSDVVDAAVVAGAARRRDFVLTGDVRELRAIAGAAGDVRIVSLRSLR